MEYALLDYIRLIGYFLVAFLLWGSVVFMRRAAYVPLAIGAWFGLSGLALFIGIVNKDLAATSLIMTWVGTPGLFILAAILMRAYWVLSTKHYRERIDD